MLGMSDYVATLARALVEFNQKHSPHFPTQTQINIFIANWFLDLNLTIKERENTSG